MSARALDIAHSFPRETTTKLVDTKLIRAAANRCQNVAGTTGGTLGTSAPDNVTADEWEDISGTVVGRTLAVWPCWTPDFFEGEIGCG